MPRWLKVSAIVLAVMLFMAVLPGSEVSAGTWWSLLPPFVAVALALLAIRSLGGGWSLVPSGNVRFLSLGLVDCVYFHSIIHSTGVIAQS